MLLSKLNKRIFVNKDILLLLLLFFGTIIVLLLLNKGDNKDILDLLIETPIIAIFTSTIVVKLLHGDNSNEKDDVVHFYPEPAKLTTKEAKETYVFANIIHYYLMNNQYKGAVKYSNTSFEY